LKMPSLVKVHSSEKKIKRRKLGTCIICPSSHRQNVWHEEQNCSVPSPAPSGGGRGEMLIVQNLPYQHVVYTKGVCNASGTGIRQLFKTLDYCFFKVWCTVPPLTSTRMLDRTQTACFMQTPL
jgi:hypothetical protein